MPNDLYNHVLTHLRIRQMGMDLHSHIQLAPSPTSKPLMPLAWFFDHVVVDNQCYMASSRATRVSEALIAVRTSANGTIWVGELQDIFMIEQALVGTHHFGRVRWFKPAAFDISNTVWHQL